MQKRNIAGIKKPRKVVFRGVTYPSMNSFAKWAREQGYKIDFYHIRLALDIGRDLEDVLAGKKFERRSRTEPVYWKGVEYASVGSLYRHLYKKRKKVFLTKEGFRGAIERFGMAKAVHRLLNPRVTNHSISKRLGGSPNLVLLRLKKGWSYYDATHRPVRKFTKKEDHVQ